MQCGFSGGEPLVRDDLEVLVAEAHRLGYYTNLLTSGVGLDERRVARAQGSGLDHVQLSFQDSTREMNDFLSHTRTFELKQRVAGMIKDQGWPMVMNCVIHRLNIDHIDRIIGMALALGAEYLELANTQYYSWAFLNRAQLLPTREQLERAERITDECRAQDRRPHAHLLRRARLPRGRPKKCVNGWGNMFLTITPDGTALPCHTARMLPGLAFPNVRDTASRDIWYRSEGFNRYRGTGWMKEPCRSCDEREKDLGGCRCQAYLLADDPAAADPVCAKSPHHGVVEEAVRHAQRPGVGSKRSPPAGVSRSEGVAAAGIRWRLRIAAPGQPEQLIAP